MKSQRNLQLGIVLTLLTLAGSALFASSHMDAPLITLDDAANTTDVYAFRSSDGSTEYLTTALAVYPFEEPGIGPNKYNFDDNVLYEIHVALGDDLAAGRKTLTYQFRFKTRFKNTSTILQSYLGKISAVDDNAQNLTQTYSVIKIDHRRPNRVAFLSVGRDPLVPPNNQGRTTPLYNINNDGDMVAKPGVDDAMFLDPYTSATVYNLEFGYRAFAGQRDDGFYADIQSIFDLDFAFGGPNKPFDSQGGFNVHTIVLDIPVDELGGTDQVVGVYATTSRPKVTVLSNDEDPNLFVGKFVQIGRQGNPLFNEAFVAIEDKDLYNRTSPERDAALFSQYALTPELAAALGSAFTMDRTDLAGIFIPDLIKIDLSTGPARLADVPGDMTFSRLGVFGGDVLMSTVQPGLPGFPVGTIPGGWPNGRRFGDDVVDIAVSAALSDLRGPVLFIVVAGDTVDSNDISYNRVFPYAATPLNGRNHEHH